MNPKISIIVIGYNIQNYIENCIESVLCQSFKDYDVIFVNDGSKDKTLEIASKFKEKIQIVDKTNEGIVSARKAGLKTAKGKYVTFVDGDDWLNTDFLKNLYEPILLNQNLDIVCSDFYFQEADESFRKEASHNSSRTTCGGYEFYDGIMLEEIDHHMFPKLYRKDFILKAGYLDYPNVTMGEDWITNAFFGLFKPDVYFSDTINYFYRFNTGSVLRKGGQKLLEQIKTLSYMEEYFREKCKFDYVQKMEYVWFAYVRSYVLANTESIVKREIIQAFKQKHIDYKNNEYCLNSINYLGKKEKLKLYIELSIPALIPSVDYIYDMAKKIRDHYVDNNNIKFEKSLEPLYDSYIELLRQDNNDKKIYLIGTSDRSNIGDHAIALSEVRLLKENFSDYSMLEITGDTFRNRRQVIKEIIKKDDIIFITGGGFLGDLWPDEEYMVNAVLEDYPENKVIVFPQTVYFYDEADSPFLREKLHNYINHKNLYLMARDEKTYDFYSKYFEKQKIALFPDMALYLEENVKGSQTNDVMICLRGDKERTISKDDKIAILNILKAKGLNVSYGSTLANGVHNGDITLPNREAAIKLKLNEFSEPRFVITDRLHGMVLSTLAGTPCIVFDNLSKKVSGVYDLWMKDIKTILFCDYTNNIGEIIDNALSIKHFKYSPDYLREEKESFVNFIKKAIGDK